LLLGRTELVDKVMRHPLARAVRIDKLTLAALTATLDLYLTQSLAELPIWNMLGASADAMAARAMTWQRRLEERGIEVEVVPAESTVGGGSLPGERLPTAAIAITPRSGHAADLLRRLREHEPPVIGRIEQERVLLDPRTVLPDEDDALLDAVVAAHA
jgi:L-seryl-tRNA(Ser) seleniumtransferase